MLKDPPNSVTSSHLYLRSYKARTVPELTNPGGLWDIITDMDSDFF